MQVFLSYIRSYLRTTHTGLLFFCIAYAALLIFFNYQYGIEPRILYNISNRFYRFAGFYLVYLMAFAVPYLALYLFTGKQVEAWKPFVGLMLLAPAIFSLKVSFGGLTAFIRNQVGGAWGKYFAIIANLPSRMVLVSVAVCLVWWLGKYDLPVFGATIKNVNWKPYFLMLLVMIPLIAWASSRHDFLNTYPKLKQVAFIAQHTKSPWLCQLLFELAYGIDFVTIELFFRGFLVLAFVRYAGQDAILPMAVFYCSIHFGKPLAECISSFFGGMLLGIVVYRTGSITGGLLVHLGIAWMMEAGGYIGNLLKAK